MVFQVLDESNVSLVPVDELAEIVVECFNPPPWNEHWTKESGKEVILSFLKKRVDVVLLKDDDGRVLSLGIGLPLADSGTSVELRALGISSDSYYIAALGTRQATRQKGGCSRCVQGLFAAARRRGFQSVCTRTRIDNAAAIHIFGKFGMQEVGRLLASTGGVESERAVFVGGLPA